MTDLELEELEREFNEKYARKIKRIKEKNFITKKKEEMKALKVKERKKRGITTTKVLCFYLFLIFNIVLFYALVAMWHFADLSYLGVIITDILAQILVYMIYSIRAFKDTQSGESIRLERDKMEGLTTNLKDNLDNLIDKVQSFDNPE